MGAIESVASGVRTVVLDLRDVPAMDATGLVSLDSAVRGLVRRGIQVILGGVQPQPLRVLERAGWASEEGKLVICAHFDDAVALARLLVPLGARPAPA
jgi:SulP family sulfate permease